MHLLPWPRTLRQLEGRTSESMRVTAAVDASIPPQGYRMEIAAEGVRIQACDAAGQFYARQTLAQLQRETAGQPLPCLWIEDWPDFPVRGFMLDISRDKVPTMATLLELVDLLASLKINQLQLYTEHTFAYRDHEIVWKDASPMTADEIRELDRSCRERFIELVPNQQSFGHLERWFKHRQYQHLAEKPEGFTFPTGKRMACGFSLNPVDPGSIRFIESLYDELLPNFTSGMLNVGCDETFDLGLGRSRSEVERVGKERVYLDFLLKIHRAVSTRGKRMMFWGDIILEKPELLSELPRDLIALNWGYEADHPFEKETAAFRAAGIPYYVCPGTSSWCSISGRTDNTLANLKHAAEQGLRNGAAGYLITDWGDYGHLQYLPISYLGLAAGAGYSWCLDSNRDANIADALDAQILRDSAKVLGRVLYEFGNVYQAAKAPLANGSRFFWALINDPDRQNLFRDLTTDEYENALRLVNELVDRLSQVCLGRTDGALILDEIRNAASMLHLACGGGEDRALRNRVIEEHRRLWLSRNRPGGLNESCQRLMRDG